MRVQRLSAFAWNNSFSFAGTKKTNNSVSSGAIERYKDCEVGSTDSFRSYAAAGMHFRSLEDKVAEEELNLPGKLAEIDLKAEKIKEESPDIWLEAKNQYESAYKKMQRSLTAGDEAIVDPLIEPEPYKANIDELDEDGNPARQIEYSGGIPEKITVMNPDGTKDVYEYDVSAMFYGSSLHSAYLEFTVKKDVKNGGKYQEADTVFEFNGGELSNVYKGVKADKSGSFSARELYNFERDNQELFAYSEGVRGKFEARKEQNVAKRVYCFNGAEYPTIFVNKKFAEHDISKGEGTPDEMYWFNKNGNVQYAHRIKADGTYEKYYTDDFKFKNFT